MYRTWRRINLEFRLPDLRVAGAIPTGGGRTLAVTSSNSTAPTNKTTCPYEQQTPLCNCRCRNSCRSRTECAYHTKDMPRDKIRHKYLELQHPVQRDHIRHQATDLAVEDNSKFSIAHWNFCAGRVQLQCLIFEFAH